MPLIAVTGGIASGKSTVSRRLAEHGAVVIDADLLSREAVEPGSPGLAAVVDRWGASVLSDEGTLDRAALGSIVFAEPTELAALNAIVHPEVRRMAAARMAAARAADPDVVIVYDVPLLVEAPVDHHYDLIVAVSAPAEERIRRLVRLRGMDEAEARQRIVNQASNAEREAIADVVIDSGGTLEQTLSQVDALWEQVNSRGPGSNVGGPA